MREVAICKYCSGVEFRGGTCVNCDVASHDFAYEDLVNAKHALEKLNYPVSYISRVDQDRLAICLVNDHFFESSPEGWTLENSTYGCIVAKHGMDTEQSLKNLSKWLRGLGYEDYRHSLAGIKIISSRIGEQTEDFEKRVLLRIRDLEENGFKANIHFSESPESYSVLLEVREES